MTGKKLFIAYKTIVRKEFLRFIKIWPQTIVPPAITAFLYFLVFGKFIGDRVGEVGSLDYVSFIAPGMIMMAIITNSYTNTSSSFFTAKFQKHIEELLVSPTPNWIKIAGYVSGGVLRGLITGLIVLLVSLLFTDLTMDNGFLIAIYFFLASTIFSLVGLLNGIYAKSFDGIAIVPTFVLTPLIYLGGIFYSIEMLPSPWAEISKFNPILYIIDGFRKGFFGVSETNTLASLSILILISVILIFFINRIFKKGVNLKN